MSHQTDRDRHTVRVHGSRPHRAFRHVALLSCAVVLLAPGCVEELGPVDEGAGYDSVDQALRRVVDGGEAEGTGDTEPGFGDETFRRAFGEDTRRGDADDLRDEVPEGGAVYHVMAVWGRVRDVEGVRAEPLRWNPEFRVNQGDAIAVRATTDLERSDTVLPRRARNLLSLLSATGGDVDGVILQLRVTDPATASLSVHTESISLRYHGRTLANLDEQHLVDRSGNGIFLTVLDETPTPEVQAQGYMAGRWTITPEGGVAGGRVMNADGEVIGHTIMEFAGGRFRGRIIDRAGNFRGTVVGRYGGGRYRGEILDINGNKVGEMSGAYAADDSGGSGRFRGTWRRTPPSSGTGTPPAGR
jgi:hypothetical protein